MKFFVFLCSAFSISFSLSHTLSSSFPSVPIGADTNWKASATDTALMLILYVLLHLLWSISSHLSMMMMTRSVNRSEDYFFFFFILSYSLSILGSNIMTRCWQANEDFLRDAYIYIKTSTSHYHHHHHHRHSCLYSRVTFISLACCQLSDSTQVVIAEERK